jgi:hypothetical protein
MNLVKSHPSVILIFLACWWIPYSPAAAQTAGFEVRSNGRDDVVITAEGDYVVSGFSGKDLILTRHNANGEVDWTRTYTDPRGRMQGSRLMQDSDGGFVVGGTIDNTPASYYPPFALYVVMKVDSQGTMLWKVSGKLGEYDRLLDIKRMPENGDYLACGYSYVGYHRGLLVRVNPAGSLVWEKFYEEPGLGTYTDLVLLSDTACLVNAEAYPFITVLKFNDNGEKRWRKSVATPDTIGASSFLIQRDTLVFCGLRGVGNGKFNYLFMKTDLDLRVVRSSELKSEYQPAMSRIIPSSDGGYFACGATMPIGIWNGVYLKTDRDGMPLWILNWGDWIQSIKEAPGGGLVFVGRKNRLNWLVTTDANGNTGMDVVSSEESGPVFYPNPAVGGVRINANLPPGTILRIYSGSGMLMKEIDQLAGNPEIPIDGLSGGIYYFQLMMPGGEGPFVRKILIERGDHR